ncbi:MAG: hypothetical protein PHN38_09220 [Sulfurospirillaceae bacterium]|nr:hypothetical protein [Sulfurospirillaceae bacterium]MDD3463332.1 hypothetical protein [Sulfurospirillaceae bacterium]
MNKIFKIFFLFVVLLCAEDKPNTAWEYEHRFVLKKDEIAKIFITESDVDKNRDETIPEKPYLLKFWWTLFSNKSLITLVNYKDHPYQYVLQQKHKLDRILVPLMPDGKNRFEEQVYLLLVLRGYDKNTKLATIDAYIKDTKRRILAKFEPENKLQE